MLTTIRFAAYEYEREAVYFEHGYFECVSMASKQGFRSAIRG